MTSLNIIGQNAKGGGYIAVVASDDDGVILVDLATGQRESVGHGAESVAFEGIKAPAKTTKK